MLQTYIYIRAKSIFDMQFKNLQGADESLSPHSATKLRERELARGSGLMRNLSALQPDSFRFDLGCARPLHDVTFHVELRGEAPQRSNARMPYAKLVEIYIVSRRQARQHTPQLLRVGNYRKERVNCIEPTTLGNRLAFS